MAEGQPYPSTPRISGEGGVPAVAKMPAAVPVGASFDELFRIMAEAAGFDGLL